MKVIETQLPGVVIIEPTVFGDHRGFFLETYRESQYQEIFGENVRFVQDNHSHSAQGVLRGLHFQVRRPQGKLLRVVRGVVFDVAVDVNPDSPTFGQWAGVTLSDERKNQFYVPPGYAHGFQVLSDVADVLYKCSDFYAPETERGFRWDDPDVAIDWPVAAPVLSPKDAALPAFAALPPDFS